MLAGAWGAPQEGATAAAEEHCVLWGGGGSNGEADDAVDGEGGGAFVEDAYIALGKRLAVLEETPALVFVVDGLSRGRFRLLHGLSSHFLATLGRKGTWVDGSCTMVALVS